MTNELGTYFTFDPAGEPFDDIGRDEVRSAPCKIGDLDSDDCACKSQSKTTVFNEVILMYYH
jgi:hypothetical protein